MEHKYSVIYSVYPAKGYPIIKNKGILDTETEAIKLMQSIIKMQLDTWNTNSDIVTYPLDDDSEKMISINDKCFIHIKVVELEA